MNTIERAVEKLRNGGVVAYPTETVYGLGCDPGNRDAVMRLLELKNRPVEKGLILIAASKEQLYRYIDSDTFLQFPHVVASWPGPNTWLLPCKKQTPVWIRGNYDTLAVRIIDHPVATELCKLFDRPIVSTSANISGKKPALDELEVKNQFPHGIDCIVPGQTGSTGQTSIIRDARTNKRIR